ncbi:MAG: hypothetical protein CMD68_00570 [Gammaproteobacteria bacterium]|nr:hypothetical protein [Gammaproteobacteria bacterium]|tara:strand:+ start:108 stop:788 length:681 start_codon:yes stop_codon:yes gene_type:complete
MNTYSILIPIHNEIRYIEPLLEELEYYSCIGHEIIIIDDGSDDGSGKALNAQEGIVLISLPKNAGKGYALREGLAKASNDRIIVYDGDMELDPADISKLMLLDRSEQKKFIMGYRFKSINPLKSNFDWGNFMFTSFFNIIFKTNHKDILCCAKAFYLSDLKGCHLSASCFDIDVELASILTVRNKNTKVDQIYIEYNRRSVEDGKKLKVSDGWKILIKIIKMARYL